MRRLAVDLGVEWSVRDGGLGLRWTWWRHGWSVSLHLGPVTLWVAGA